MNEEVIKNILKIQQESPKLYSLTMDELYGKLLERPVVTKMSEQDLKALHSRLIENKKIEEQKPANIKLTFMDKIKYYIIKFMY